MDEREIEFWQRKLIIPFDIFFSEDLFTDEEKYITDPSLKLDPVTIVLNKTRKIVFLEDMNMNEKEILNSLMKILLRRIEWEKTDTSASSFFY